MGAACRAAYSLPLPCCAESHPPVRAVAHYLSVSQQLLKFKDQLSAEEGSEVADALESLSASQPKKRGKCWVRGLTMGLAGSSHPIQLPVPAFPICSRTVTINVPQARSEYCVLALRTSPEAVRAAA